LDRSEVSKQFSAVVDHCFCKLFWWLFDINCPVRNLFAVYSQSTWRQCSVSRYQVIGRARTCGSHVSSITRFCVIVSANRRQWHGWLMDRNKMCSTFATGLLHCAPVSEMAPVWHWNFAWSYLEVIVP